MRTLRIPMALAATLATFIVASAALAAKDYPNDGRSCKAGYSLSDGRNGGNEHHGNTGSLHTKIRWIEAEKRYEFSWNMSKGTKLKVCPRLEIQFWASDGKTVKKTLRPQTGSKPKGSYRFAVKRGLSVSATTFARKVK